MEMENFKKTVINLIEDYNSYRNKFTSFETFDLLKLSKNQIQVLKKLSKRLYNTYPTFHPNYIGQMIKPPVDLAILSYFVALFYNSNNHALDGGPETSYLEKETIKEIAKLMGYKKFLGHLTSGGTVANLEGLWISKLITKNRLCAICENAHYTHTRLSKVIDFNYELIPMDRYGKMDIDTLERKLRSKKIGTVVSTIGTTGLGALDDLVEILKLKDKFNFRLHVDAAYGGFFKVLADNNSKLINKEIYDKLSQADSIVVDPHKHGLQPYGCGCILFRDPKIGKYYKHDSPYTYFTSKKLHLGEVTLECSRPGAAAASLWTVLKAFPLKKKKGFYQILEYTRLAALKFSELIKKSDEFSLLVEPELDIVNFFPKSKSTKDISKKSEALFNDLMRDKNYPIFLSKYRVNSNFFKKLFNEVNVNSPEVIVLRSVLMKPEHYYYIEDIFQHILKAQKKISK